MLGILFKVTVKAEKRQAFIEFIEWDIQVAKESEPGTLRFDLYRDPADENAFFVYEAYRDNKAFEEHQKNPPYQRWVSQIEPEMVDDFQLLFNVDAVLSFGGSIPIPP
jgi:autoinducer 2-degrading protein